MLTSTVSTRAMEFASSLNAEQGEESVQHINFGCHCGATDHGVFIFKQILRDHGRDALGWARQWEKFSIKEARLASKLHTIWHVRFWDCGHTTYNVYLHAATCRTGL